MQKQHQKMMERQTEKLQQSLEQNKGDKQTLAIHLDTATVNNIPVKGN